MYLSGSPEGDIAVSTYADEKVAGRVVLQHHEFALQAGEVLNSLGFGIVHEQFVLAFAYFSTGVEVAATQP